MFQKLKLKILACKIEYQWLFITPGRKKANKIIDALLAQGQSPLNSMKLATLYRRISRRCTQVSALTQKYKKLAEMET